MILYTLLYSEDSNLNFPKNLNVLNTINQGLESHDLPNISKSGKLFYIDKKFIKFIQFTAVELINRLLEPNPLRRININDALEYSWLKVIYKFLKKVFNSNSFLLNC